MAVDRSKLPPPGPHPPFALPKIHRRRLANGIDAWAAEHRDVPLVSLLVLIRAGAAFDPADRPGLAAITGDLLDDGCGDLDALAFHDRLGRLGAQLDTEIGADAVLLGITALQRFAAPAFSLLADMVAAPRLEDRDFERVRDLRLNRLLQLREMPPAVAERVFTQLLYGSHPYGHLPIGSEPSLQAMNATEPRAYHAAMYVPGRVALIAVGDAPPDTLFDLMDAAFGSWAPAGGGVQADPTMAAGPERSPAKIVLVPRAAAPQSELRIGHVAVPRSSPDYHALMALNLVLGGQFVSRINLNLRERRGYTYGARTSFEFRRGPGPFVLHASVQSEPTAEAVREALAELTAIRGERPVTREELELGRAPLTRGYPRRFETAEQVARGMAQLALYDLPDTEFSDFVPRVLALTPDDLTRAAATHIDPSRLVTVIVGDPDKVEGPLLALGLGEPTEIASA